MKKILQISFTVILLAGTLFLLGFADKEHQAKVYRLFTVELFNSSDQSLITEQEIREMISEKFGEIEGARMMSVNLHKLENFVRNNPYISSCEVYQKLGGTLVIKARVREPLVRVINEGLQQYLLDQNGFLMPVNPDKPSHILIANGSIADSYVSLDGRETPLSNHPDQSVLRQIYTVALYISRDPFLRSFIDQVYVTETQELELVPKIGHQTIIFGQAEDTEEKLENLKIFYHSVMNKISWSTYQIINLKYKNQVVCTK
ncbi:MAG: hypothetical protein K0B08_05105 [Bacteroidales bacterium]|nr:hypothetical protein [Bacteroidales bacterium]